MFEIGGVSEEDGPRGSPSGTAQAAHQDQASSSKEDLQYLRMVVNDDEGNRNP